MTSPDFGLTNKVALVTGASRGIGQRLNSKDEVAATYRTVVNQLHLYTLRAGAVGRERSQCSKK